MVANTFLIEMGAHSGHKQARLDKVSSNPLLAMSQRPKDITQRVIFACASCRPQERDDAGVPVRLTPVTSSRLPHRLRKPESR